ncbi:MAG: class I SAM-dependent methyltransferase [Chloroflexota bacterium]|nr:class I SAM-dependent methyltransferase [Chloroflexota bacterium]
MTGGPRICDYGDSSYREDFWEGQGRDYEDVVERQVLAQLLPERGQRLLEVGAGFGRISLEYSMYDQVVLLDYSLEQLIYARQQMGDERFTYVAADAYRMPFCAGAFDCATMIRVIHHFEDVPAALSQVRTCLCHGGKFILEYANKRHLKSMLRYLLGRNNWNPYALEPVEFVELNFNFHPDYIQAEVGQLGFDIRRVAPVSWLRLGLLKRTLPMSVLSGIDSVLQRTGWRLSPSIFLSLQLGEALYENTAAESRHPLDILRCPRSASPLRRDGDVLISANGLRWGVVDGVYDFRQPLP